ncbi:hypothetical protein J132_03868 [Termitomyces sp. J132]|nr:hypothetical protein J132_03868 [Termitomyces sp. J132]
MFPTLFPYGCGGFDHPKCPTKLGFQVHVNYLMDSADHLFCYHYSFMFIALNIIQCRTAYLHTGFTVKTSCFNIIAEELVSLSSDNFLSAAKHLEENCNPQSLSDDEKKVDSVRG